MIRSIIVENELKAQKLLSSIIAEFIPEVSLVGMAANISDALILIENQKPELIFLDIELDDGSAFELLEKIPTPTFKVIFITAYDRFALKAFEYEAIDYIVKPYSPVDIMKAVNRLDKMPLFNSFREELLNILKKERYHNSKITVSNSQGLVFIRLGDIIRLEGERSYCTFHLRNREKVLVSKPLKEFAQNLPTEYFYRIHQSHLINLEFIKKISNEDGGFVIMENNDQVPIAKRRRKDFFKFLEK